MSGLQDPYELKRPFPKCHFNWRHGALSDHNWKQLLSVQQGILCPHHVIWRLIIGPSRMIIFYLHRRSGLISLCDRFFCYEWLNGIYTSGIWEILNSANLQLFLFTCSIKRHLHKGCKAHTLGVSPIPGSPDFNALSIVAVPLLFSSVLKCHNSYFHNHNHNWVIWCQDLDSMPQWPSERM